MRTPPEIVKEENPSSQRFCHGDFWGGFGWTEQNTPTRCFHYYHNNTKAAGAISSINTQLGSLKELYFSTRPSDRDEAENATVKRYFQWLQNSLDNTWTTKDIGHGASQNCLLLVINWYGYILLISMGLLCNDDKVYPITVQKSLRISVRLWNNST